MICQVCKKNVLSELSLRCPSCATDLSVLHHLENVQEKYVNNAKQRTFLEGSIATQKKENIEEIGRWKRKAIRIGSLFLLFPLWYKCCIIPPTDTVATQYAIAQRDSILAYSKMLERQIIDLQQDTSVWNATKVRSIKYTLEGGESLSQLGLKFFNDKKAGYRIAKDNRLTAKEYTSLPVGKILIINFR